jgi:hypothetical protein
MANKINQWHVYLIGAVLMLLLGFGLYFMLLKPLYETKSELQTKNASADATTVSVDGKSFGIGSLKEADQAATAAITRKDSKKAQLASLMNRKQLPPAQRIDLGKGTQPEVLGRTMPRWLSLPKVLVTKMERYAQRLGDKHGVVVFTKFSVPAPSTNPESIPKDIIARNLGSMTVIGEFNRVLRWAQDWNSAPLLVAVDGLKCGVVGPGGHVVATCNLTVYLFPTGEAVTQPGAGAPSPGGASPGMPGMPGAPPGMPGMPGAPPGMSGNMAGNSPRPGGPPTPAAPSTPSGPPRPTKD